MRISLYSQEKKYNCNDLSFKYYYYDFNFFEKALQEGQILFVVNNNGELIDTINSLILDNSEHILSEWLFMGLINDSLKSQPKMIFFSETNFLDSLSYEERQEPKYHLGVDVATIITNTYCYQNILTYETTFHLSIDRWSPYKESIVIDLNRLELFNIKYYLEEKELDELKEFVVNYSNTHKIDVANNYKTIMSEQSDHLLAEYTGFLYNDIYDHENIKCEINDISPSFKPEGVVFGIKVTDYNFLKYDCPHSNGIQNTENFYWSYIIIPYSNIEAYLKEL